MTDNELWKLLITSRDEDLIDAIECEIESRLVDEADASSGGPPS